MENAELLLLRLPLLEECQTPGGFRKEQAPPFLLLAVATAFLSWTVLLRGIGVNNYPSSLMHLSERVLGESGAQMVQGVQGGKRSPLLRVAGSLSFYSCVMQEQWHSVLQICSCGHRQFHKLVRTHHAVK